MCKVSFKLLLSPSPMTFCWEIRKWGMNPPPPPSVSFISKFYKNFKKNQFFKAVYAVKTFHFNIINPPPKTKKKKIFFLLGPLLVVSVCVKGGRGGGE